MTKHFTHAEFVKRFMDEFLDQYHTDREPCTRIMGTIFEKHRKEVSEHLEGCLAYLDMEIANGYGGTTHEHVGYNFHKGFRQHGVIDAPLMDGIVWTCIGDSNLFWETMNAVASIHDHGEQKVAKPLDTLAD